MPWITRDLSRLAVDDGDLGDFPIPVPATPNLQDLITIQRRINPGVNVLQPRSTPALPSSTPSDCFASG
jgi:hypothetical protein